MFIGKSLSKTHSALCARCSTAVRRAVLSRRRASRQQAGWLLKLRGHSPSPSAPAAPCALAWRHREGLQLPWTHRTYPNQHQSPSASAHKTNRARGAGKLGEKGGRDGNGERDGQSWGINCRGCNTNEWPQNLWSVFSLCCCSFFFFMFLMLVLFFSPWTACYLTPWEPPGPRWAAPRVHTTFDFGRRDPRRGGNAGNTYCFTCLQTAPSDLPSLSVPWGNMYCNKFIIRITMI